jgi:hypothetical protein
MSASRAALGCEAVGLGAQRSNVEDRDLAFPSPTCWLRGRPHR